MPFNQREELVIAEINGEAITRKDLMPFAFQNPPEADGLFTDDEKHMLIEKLIEHNYAKRSDIAKSHHDLRIRST